MPSRFLNPRASGLMTFGGGGGEEGGNLEADIDKLGNRGYAPGGDVTGSPDAGKEADLKNAGKIRQFQTALTDTQAQLVRLESGFKNDPRTNTNFDPNSADGIAERSRLNQLAKFQGGNLQNFQEDQFADISQQNKAIGQQAVLDPTGQVTGFDSSDISADTSGTSLTVGTGKAGSVTDAVNADAATDSADAPDTVTADTYTAAGSQEETEKKLKDLVPAEGEFTDENKVDKVTGRLSDDALAGEDRIAKDRVLKVDENPARIVTPEELATAEGLDEDAVKAKIADALIPDNIKAAQTSVAPEEIPKPAQIKEEDMATAQAITDDGLNPDAVAVAAKLAKFTVDAETLAEFKEGKIEAQDTVQGQLASLMQDFDDGTPAWAAGAMRAANSAMRARGLGSSSMAAAAIVQASMESAIPIASADANAFREMKMDNLGRQQQVALSNAAAQQGVEISNFSAEQQAALQNSQNAFSLQTQNLSNTQSVVLANAQIKASLQGKNLDNQQQANLVEAARYAEVNNVNLNNRQQGILQDNANELQVNLANMSTKQQAYLANAQIESALQGKKIDNRQQVSMQKASRFAESNNLTFTAEQQTQLHNSELMKTIGLTELSGKQAATLQNAATVAAMDMSNASNAQQAAIQNAQAFLSIDMANMTNEQQASLFKAKAIQDSILSDTAADNAALQFNSTSQNQTDQFMTTMKQQVETFNATQTNTIEMFNKQEDAALSKFNAEQKNARDEFNADNALIVAQANAKWRQGVVTTNTAAQNEANMNNAKASNAFTSKTLDEVWQSERDILAFAWKSGESEAERTASIMRSQISAKAGIDVANVQKEWDAWANIAGLIL